MSRSKIALALIHNNDVARNACARPQLEALREALARSSDVSLTEVAFQPQQVEPISTSMSMYREISNAYNDISWQRYRESRVTYVKTIFRLLRRLARLYIFRGDAFHRRLRASAIEVILTDKHIRAWGQMLDGDADVLIVSEDDAIFHKESIDLVCDAVVRAVEGDPSAALYVDLAGGISLTRLGVGRLISSVQGRIVVFERPVTNTTCAYLVNRAAVSVFHGYLINKPNYRLISVDWLLNRLFMDMRADKRRCACFHFDPPALVHGSISAGLGSSIR